LNIFILDTNVELCAQYHNDKHVVKMILESAQMLSTANRSTGLDEGYKATHVNHPCNKWLRESLANWLWLRDLVWELHEEWRYRYDHPSTKTHKSMAVVAYLSIPNLPDISRTPFALAMPDEYKCDDPVKAYRDYYMKDKSHLAGWRKRGEPEWWINF
jgi:hypothetical protein